MSNIAKLLVLRARPFTQPLRLGTCIAYGVVGPIPRERAPMLMFKLIGGKMLNTVTIPVSGPIACNHSANSVMC